MGKRDEINEERFQHIFMLIERDPKLAEGLLSKIHSGLGMQMQTPEMAHTDFEAAEEAMDHVMGLAALVTQQEQRKKTLFTDDEIKSRLNTAAEQFYREQQKSRGPAH